MNLIELIEMHPGVDNARQLAGLAKENPEIRDELWKLTSHERNYISRVAAWALEHCFLENPEIIAPYLPEMAKRLPEVPTDSLRRHFLKMLWIGGFSEDQQGVLADICFRWMMDPERPTAVKMFSLRILYDISESEPDLKPELAAVIEDQLPKGTPGFKNAGRKILNKLYRQIG